MPHPSVGPLPARPDSGHHPGGAHGPRPHPHLDDVGPGVQQVVHRPGRNDVARRHRKAPDRRPHSFNASVILA